MLPFSAIVAVLLSVLLLAVAVPASAQTEALAMPQMVNVPSDVGYNVRDYGVRGDGVTDDTAAIRALIQQLRPQWRDYYGLPALIYFPPGTYLIRDTLSWVGCCLALQGAGTGQTTIRLADNTTGFTNPAAPKAVIQTDDGNMSFRQYIQDITIDVGNGNRGAVAIDYITSNTGALRDLIVRSGDGQGLIGIAMTRQWPGPGLLKDIHISGFGVGIDVGTAEYGMVLQGITLTGMSIAGIRNNTNTLAIRNLTTEMSAPAIISRNAGSSIILLDSTLRSGGAGVSALEVEGDLYARNVTTSGYRSVIATNGTVVPGTNVTEYVRGQRLRLDPTSLDRMLNLPIRDVPAFDNNDLASWGRFQADYNSGAAVRALTTLFSNPAYTTIYFRTGASIWGNSRLVVPSHVRRIVGFMHQLNNWDGVGLVLEVNDNSSEPLIIEGVNARIVHRGTRPVVIRDTPSSYTAEAGAGNVFFENVVMEKIHFQPGQRVWAWQFNTEHMGDPAMIVNNGANVWMIGVKTEMSATVAETIGGGRTEIYGTLVYPACSPMPANRAMFVNSESHLTLIMSFSNYAGCTFYPVIVRETRGGVTRELRTINGRTVSLYAGANAWLPGDVNGDGAVTLVDFSLLARSFNLRLGDPNYDPRADFNGDSTVSLADFSLLATYFNRVAS